MYSLQQPRKSKNYRDLSSFQGKHWSLEQDFVHVLVHSPFSPSQHLQTSPSVEKKFEDPVIAHTKLRLAFTSYQQISVKKNRD
jgi:hypothetical protein